ncbi:MAG: hypothetical protein KJ606_09650 [Chloroflexi bacterium]|nr:hypothetical protein [Chloroflexota bacterium]
MKSKSAYLILAVGLLVILVGGIRYQQVSAQRITLREILKLEPISTADSIGVIQQETTEESEESDSPPSEQFPNSVFVSSEQKTKNDEVIAALKEIRDKADQTHLSPGWLRITSQTESFFALSATLPNGAPVPTKSINDIWALLDDKGYALMAVMIDDTGDPRTSQTVVFQDGIWTNISISALFPPGMEVVEEMTSQEKETYRPTYDGSDGIASAELYKDIISLSLDETEVDVNGESAIVVSSTQLFKEPMSLAKSSTTLAGAGGKTYYSVDTGLVIRMEDYHVYPTGEIKIIRQWTLLNIEKVDTPPDSILAYFSK